MQLDSAADVTVLTESTWRSIGSPALSAPSTSALDVNKNALPVMGETEVTISFLGLVRRGGAFVTGTDTDLLGIDWHDLFLLWNRAPSSFCLAVTTAQEITVEKCKFFEKEVEYLVIIVDDQGKRSDPEKLEAISTMPAPQNAS